MRNLEIVITGNSINRATLDGNSISTTMRHPNDWDRVIKVEIPDNKMTQVATKNGLTLDALFLQEVSNGEKSWKQFFCQGRLMTTDMQNNEISSFDLLNMEITDPRDLYIEADQDYPSL